MGDNNLPDDEFQQKYSNVPAPTWNPNEGSRIIADAIDRLTQAIKGLQVDLLNGDYTVHTR